MTNEQLNTMLYQKMFAEQEAYCKWLVAQPPKEILSHTYEYTVHEEILMSVECNNFPNKQVKALLKSSCPLEDVFRDFEKRETNHMDAKTGDEQTKLKAAGAKCYKIKSEPGLLI